MSERLAQLYGGNPLGITEEELQAIAARHNRFGPHARTAEVHFVSRAVPGGKGRSGKPAVWGVELPALRGRGPLQIATFSSEEKAALFVDALKYMDLFVAAVRELRRRPELIAKNQLAMKTDLEKGLR